MNFNSVRSFPETISENGWVARSPTFELVGGRTLEASVGGLFSAALHSFVIFSVSSFYSMTRIICGQVYPKPAAFLPGLASACVDNTTGGLFNSPASVAVDIRKEMVEYITQRSETFVTESVILEGGPDVQASVHPYDIIADFFDDFASSKQNIFSRVSGWLRSERR
ncbi:hypothetical protein Vadar_025252 [Vaccinium darrowii]|uniref:Uncharacterized protein n=1 Tax=Vaccinium darrowii TaxID=229202 RepID=A0ACB7YAF7_9ERIC|nr:hypothetical protein Vadar_025252 [Vaccinium darrowii]